ncbi:MAG: Trans-aconitate 2-methyltransferase [Actinomycetia bacterium]|nr:Trans-aconitate 2-methyltransferase [Actinomycetes bacterium]
MAVDWDPAQYDKFAAERRQPFDELVGLLGPTPGGRVADLGCGPGNLTAELQRALGAAEVVGVDSSPAMLAEAAGQAGGGVTFEAGDLATWDGGGRPWDAVVASASLHWVPDHEVVLRRWAGALADGGQLAVQVPANADHPSHLLIDEVAAELGVTLPPDTLHNVLAPDRYAELLDELGFVRQHVRLQVFGHHLDSTADVVEWTKGTAQLRARRAMDEDTYEQFLAEYRRRLLAALGDRSPYFYAFKRILFVASR